MNLARSSLKIFGANITKMGIGFLGITYFARELGAAPMGVFFLFQALLGMLAIPADFGLRGAVEKRISEGKSLGTILSSAIALKLVPITVIVSVILLFQSIVNSYIGADVAVFLAAAIVLQEVAKLSIVVLKGELRVGETAVLLFAQRATWVGVSTVFVSFGFGVIGLIYGLLAGLGVMLIWGWQKASISLKRPSREHARSLFNYGKYNLISSIGGFFYSWMDVAIIGLFLSQAHVGAYEVAWRVTAVVMLASRSIATAVFPQISQWDTENAKGQIEKTIREAIFPSIILTLPSFLGVLLFSKQILGLVFGPEFTIAWLALIILMGEKVIQSVHQILGKSLKGINRPDLAAKAGIVAIIFNLILNLILIPNYGIVGAALATVFSFLVNSLLHAHYLSLYIDIKLPFNEIASSIVASLGMTIILFAINSGTGINTLPQLLLIIFTGVLLYGGFSLLIPSLRRSIIDQVKRIF